MILYGRVRFWIGVPFRWYLGADGVATWKSILTKWIEITEAN